MKVSPGKANLSARKCFLIAGLLGCAEISTVSCEGYIGGETLNLSEKFGLNHEQGKC